MAEVVLFQPRVKLDAAANLREFIDCAAIRITVFGADLRFDEGVWDVTETLELKAKSGASRLVFSTWASASDRVPQQMVEPFCSFAKANLRYQQGARPTKSVSTRLAAMRALEVAMTENGGPCEPCRIHAVTFDRAAQLAKDRFSAGGAYRVTGQLEMLVRFISDHHDIRRRAMAKSSQTPSR